ncbi:uncharacterized protein LOC123313897 [Coccinella septempunctata]|uniref:uncharacterized protein LOC123313897 n=1 Tax=Coccinella septempunctata TaxID=41139 RepID=UPI001D05E51D|nr:uncharacterized protein LOC123313897 [Coccinella septempunctata]
MNSKVICAVIGLGLLALAAAGPMVDNNKGHVDNLVNTNEYTTVEASLLKKLNTKCSTRDISSCMMLKLVTYFNKMLKKSMIEYGDIEITQTSTETISEESSRSLNDVENMSEEEQISEVITDKLSKFIRTRSLKWKAFDGTDVVVTGSTDKDGSTTLGFSLKPDESTGNGDARKKKNNGMGMMIAAAAMKIGLLKALAFKALVLLVGKALLVSKLALVLAVVIGLKKLFSQEKHVTYEVVAHPHHEHASVSSGGGHDSYGGGGWGRTFDAQGAQNLAYKAHVPTN